MVIVKRIMQQWVCATHDNTGYRGVNASPQTTVEPGCWPCIPRHRSMTALRRTISLSPRRDSSANRGAMSRAFSSSMCLPNTAGRSRRANSLQVWPLRS